MTSTILTWIQDTTPVLEFATALIGLISAGWAVLRRVADRRAEDRPDDTNDTSGDQRKR